MVDPPSITVDQDKVAHWISNGAQPTDSVKQLLNSLETNGNAVESAE